MGKSEKSEGSYKGVLPLAAGATRRNYVMYGDDFEEGGIAARWAGRKQLSQNIKFCGFLPHRELLKHLKTMSILLHPALEESFGMAVTEAMALGLPVVAG